jgi:hypothetical protein
MLLAFAWIKKQLLLVSDCYEFGSGTPYRSDSHSLVLRPVWNLP